MANDTSIPHRFAGGYWQVPAFLEYVHPILTAEAVAAAEAQLGVALPLAYLELLREQNGGYLRGSWPETVATRLYGIGDGYPSITRDQAWWRPKNVDGEIWSPPHPELLIPFDGDGHWDMCFDYRKEGPKSEPTVTLIDCECEHEEAIAPSFVDYLDGLVDESADAETRIYGDIDAETVARRISQHLEAPEPTVDTFAHGYPIWRIALPGISEWCWCSPNRVPAGFRRDGREVIVTDATALRIPEEPDCVVFVSCTEDSKTAVSAALTALRLDAR